MMNCKQATQLLSEKQDRPLSKKERLSLRLHTMICSACRQFDKQMTSLSVFAQSYMKSNKKD